MSPEQSSLYVVADYMVIMNKTRKTQSKNLMMSLRHVPWDLGLSQMKALIDESTNQVTSTRKRTRLQPPRRPDAENQPLFD